MNATESVRTLRLLLVDDHPIVRAGLMSILSADPRMQVVGAARSGAEAVALSGALRPDLVVLDLRLPDGAGTGRIVEIKAAAPGCRVTILTSFVDAKEVFAALEAGVDGYLLKESDEEALKASLLAIAHGEQVLHPQILRLVMGQGGGALPVAGTTLHLTEAERRILHLVSDGQTNKEIAAMVGLSEKTVRNQMTQILRKLGVERRSQAVAVYVRNG